MSNTTNLGAVAYNAYCESRNWKSFNGNPLPAFDKQSPELQAAWMHAAKAVLDADTGSAEAFMMQSVDSIIEGMEKLCADLRNIKHKPL